MLRPIQGPHSTQCRLSFNLVDNTSHIMFHIIGAIDGLSSFQCVSIELTDNEIEMNLLLKPDNKRILDLIEFKHNAISSFTRL